MADVFISYSRRDSAFVEELSNEIAERGKSVWLDTEGIADGEVFPAALQRAIETSAGFVFVISPESASSPYCAQEVELALALNKRIIPVVHQPVPDDALPEGIRVRNWIPGSDPEHTDRVVTALDHDLEHVREHTRWGLKALEWDQRERDGSLLLRGSELAAAERWLAGSAGKEPEPTDLQRDYVRAAHAAARRRQRVLTGVSVAVAALSVVLVVYALVSRGQAREQRRQAVSARITARSQALAATAVSNLDSDPQVSLVLAARAVRMKTIPQSLFALRGALDAVSLLGQYDAPPAQPRACAKQGNANVPVTTALMRPGRPELTEFGCDGSIRVHDSRTGAIRRRLATHSAILSSAYSPDGAVFAVADRNAVTVRDADSLAVRRRLPVRGPRAGSTYVVFASDSTLLEAVYGGHASWATVRGVDVATGRVTPVLDEPVATDMAPLGTDRLLIGTDRASVLVLDARTGKRLGEIRTPGQHDYPTLLAVSPDGRRIAVGIATRAGSGRVVLYDGHTLRRLGVVTDKPDVGILAMAFGPDSRRLGISGTDGTGDVRDVTDGQKLVSFGGRGASIQRIAFSTDGAQVTTSDNTGTVRTWRTLAQIVSRVPGEFVPAGQIGALALSGDTLTALGPVPGRAARVRRWTLPFGKPAAGLRLPPGSYPTAFNSPSSVYNNAAALSADGRAVLTGGTGGRPLRLVTVAAHRTLRTFPGELYGTATIAPDLRTVIVSGGQASTNAAPAPGVILRAGAGRPIPLQTPRDQRSGWRSTDANTSIGRRWFAQVFPGHVNVWDTRTGALRRSLAVASPNVVALDEAHGLIAVGANNGNTSIYSLASGRRVRTLTATASVNDLYYTPDGARLITTTNDKTAHVWDPAAGRELRRYALPAGSIRLAVSANGEQFAISGTDGVIRVFDTCTACTDGPALLRLARDRPRVPLTPAERDVIAAA